MRPLKPELDKVPHSISLSLKAPPKKYLTKTNQPQRTQRKALNFLDLNPMILAFLCELSDFARKYFSLFEEKLTL
jgi:hypothetical protein